MRYSAKELDQLVTVVFAKLSFGWCLSDDLFIVPAEFCPKEGDTDCSAADLKGFKYRTDAGGAWFTKPVKGQPGQIIIPLQKTPLFTSAVSGSPDMLAARDAVRRLAEIRLLSGKLFGEQKELLNGLEKASDKKRKVNEYLVM